MSLLGGYQAVQRSVGSSTTSIQRAAIAENLVKLLPDTERAVANLLVAQDVAVKRSSTNPPSAALNPVSPPSAPSGRGPGPPPDRRGLGAPASQDPLLRSFPAQVPFSLCLNQLSKDFSSSSAAVPRGTSCSTTNPYHLSRPFWAQMEEFCGLAAPVMATRQLCVLLPAFGAAHTAGVLNNNNKHFVHAILTVLRDRDDLNDRDRAGVLTFLTKVFKELPIGEEFRATVDSWVRVPQGAVEMAAAVSSSTQLESSTPAPPAKASDPKVSEMRGGPAQMLVNICYAAVKLNLASRFRICEEPSFRTAILGLAFKPQEEANLMFVLGNLVASEAERTRQRPPRRPCAEEEEAPRPCEEEAARASPRWRTFPEMEESCSSSWFSSSSLQEKTSAAWHASTLSQKTSAKSLDGQSVRAPKDVPARVSARALMKNFAARGLAFDRMRVLELVMVASSMAKANIYLSQVGAPLYNCFSENDALVKQLQPVELAILANALSHWPAAARPDVLLAKFSPVLQAKTRIGKKGRGGQVHPHHILMVLHSYAKVGVRDVGVFGPTYFGRELLERPRHEEEPPGRAAGGLSNLFQPPPLFQLNPQNFAQLLISMAKVDCVPSAWRSTSPLREYLSLNQNTSLADFSDPSLLGLLTAHRHPALRDPPTQIEILAELLSRGSGRSGGAAGSSAGAGDEEKLLRSQSFALQADATLWDLAMVRGVLGKKLDGGGLSLQEALTLVEALNVVERCGGVEGVSSETHEQVEQVLLEVLEDGGGDLRREEQVGISVVVDMVVNSGAGRI